MKVYRNFKLVVWLVGLLTVVLIIAVGLLYSGRENLQPKINTPLVNYSTEEDGTITVQSLGINFQLPKDYRIAEHINRSSALNSPRMFQITRAPEAEEQEYVEMIERMIREGQEFGIEEDFSSGNTIVILGGNVSDIPSEDTIASCAEQVEKIRNNPFLSGTRYRKGGCYKSGDPDVAIFVLPSGKRIHVALAYPRSYDESGLISYNANFDEEAFQTIIRTLRPTP